MVHSISFSLASFLHENYPAVISLVIALSLTLKILLTQLSMQKLVMVTQFVTENTTWFWKLASSGTKGNCVPLSGLLYKAACCQGCLCWENCLLCSKCDQR